MSNGEFYALRKILGTYASYNSKKQSDMSLRGIKFSFESDENVLCFEPDLSKARVLYEARVSEHFFKYFFSYIIVI